MATRSTPTPSRRTWGEMVERLLAGMPTAPARWAELHRADEVQLRIGIHLEAWNRGLTFSAASVARFAAMAVPMMLDIDGHCEADTA